MHRAPAKNPEPTANEYAGQLTEYVEAGAARAEGLGNRGSVRLDGNGRLHADILDAYWRHGFYVFEGVVAPEPFKAGRRFGENDRRSDPVQSRTRLRRPAPTKTPRASVGRTA